MTAQRQANPTGLYGSNIGANMLAAAAAETIGTFILVYGGTAVTVAALINAPVAGGPATTRLPPLSRSAWRC